MLHVVEALDSSELLSPTTLSPTRRVATSPMYFRPSGEVRDQSNFVTFVSKKRLTFI